MEISRRTLLKALAAFGITKESLAEPEPREFWEDEEPYDHKIGVAPAYERVPQTGDTEIYHCAKMAMLSDPRFLLGPFVVQPVGEGFVLDLRAHQTVDDLAGKVLSARPVRTVWDIRENCLLAMDSVVFEESREDSLWVEGFVVHHVDGRLLTHTRVGHALDPSCTLTAQWLGNPVMSVS